MSVSGEAGAVGKDFLPQEDTVEYCLYSSEEYESQQLAKLAAQCSRHAQHITREHIWHYDSFSLEVCAGKRGSQPACLYGSTCFRENVEDEWLIVYILFSISGLYSQLVISVKDNDGQLLLVESAHKLPPWLEPETAANRVFIHKGQLHIIPKPRSPAEVTSLPVSSPTLQEAVRIVLDEAIPTVASEPVQQCIRERLKRFSEDLGSKLHFAHCYVPLPVAHVMSHDPQLVSAVVHALCDRDPIDMKACQRMAHFSPCNHSSIMAGIKFTKRLYAQLLHQRFSAPRNSGFRVPPAGNQRHTACELGMKVTCGLEILVSRVKHRVSKTAGSTSECLEGDKRWQKFVKSLESKGYFQDEIEGSRLYQQLLSSAKDHFISHLQNETEEPMLSPLVLAGRKALHILQNISLSEEELIRRSELLKPPDDDSWLQISPEELDDMMKRAAGYLPPLSGAPSSQAKVQQGLGTKATAAFEGGGSAGGGGEDLDLQSMVYGMKSFVKKVSSHKGAEFPWTGEESSEVTFDPDSVLDMMKAMLNTASPNEEERGNPDSMDDTDLLSGGDFSGAEEEDDLSVREESSVEGEGISGARKEEKMEEIMDEMDREISLTEVGKSFEKLKVVEDPEEDHTEVGGALQPVDVDFNLIKNLLESYTSQEGGAGPASNILQSLGIHIPEQDSYES